MKYYYVVYAHGGGMGATTFQCSRFLDLKKARQWIIDNANAGNSIVITSFFELTEEQFKEGI